MTEQLKPCPFCGGQPKRVSTSFSERFAYAQEVSYVCSCGCRRSARGDTSKGGYADNSKVEENALAAWNTRALTTSQPAQAGELLKCAMRHTPVWKSGVSGLPYQESNFACETCGYVGKHDMHPGCKKAAQPAAQATPVQDVGASADYWGDLAQQKADADARRGVSMPVSYYTSSIVGALLATQQATPEPVGEPDTVPLDALHAAERERDYWKTRARAMLDHAEGTCWYWMGDGEDHLESLVSSLPVVIRADQLRELLAHPAPGVPEVARDALERIASWNEHPAMLGVDYGSNGVRDYYRKIARDALAAAQAKGGE